MTIRTVPFEKLTESQRIDALVDKYVANGGEIKKVARGVKTYKTTEIQNIVRESTVLCA